MKSIQTVAKQTNISVPTLRYYDELGLLPNLKRNKNGYRQFSERDISDVNLVKCFREVGVPIKQIKEIVSAEELNQKTIGRRLQVLQEQRNALLEQRRQIDISLLAMQVKTARYRALLQDPTAVEHGEEELVKYFVQYTRKEKQQYVTDKLTALFEQFKQHQASPSVLSKTYSELTDCFEPEYLPEVSAAFELLTGLQY